MVFPRSAAHTPAGDFPVRRRWRSLARFSAAAAMAGAALLGSTVEMGVASADAIGHGGVIRPAEDAALDGVVADRLNVIRVSFGLATGQSTTDYRDEVTNALLSNEDPRFIPLAGPVLEEGSLWGIVVAPTDSSTSSALEIVNGWVYHDGWDGSVQATWNADCTSAHARGCDGHRRNVLMRPPAPGAKLYIDVEARSVTYDGSPAIAVAALLVWKAGSTNS